jgi:hypothetical protein
MFRQAPTPSTAATATARINRPETCSRWVWALNVAIFGTKMRKNRQEAVTPDEGPERRDEIDTNIFDTGPCEPTISRFLSSMSCDGERATDEQLECALPPKSLYTIYGVFRISLMHLRLRTR